jgi:hypothetical protein
MKTLNQVSKELNAQAWPKERKAQFKRECKIAKSQGKDVSLLAFDSVSYSLALKVKYSK